MGLQVYMNGEMVPQEEAKVSVWDHCFLYGDGVFEGIRAYNGRVWKLDEHIERLYQSACAIQLTIPLTREQMKDALLETLQANNLRDSYIRLVVSRGVGDLGIDVNNCPSPTVVIIAAPLKLYPQEMYETGLEVVTCSIRRNTPACVDPSIKSCNYLNNILAKIEVLRQGLKEGVMLNPDGYVAECTADNIFAVNGRQVITPPVTDGALRGITRAEVLRIAGDLDYDPVERTMTQYDLYTAQECFLSGSGAEIIAVVKIDGRPIGNGKPGPITNELLTEFRRRTVSEGTPIYEKAPAAAR
jgi:branched-chain amino acid aminotransferase